MARERTRADESSVEEAARATPGPVPGGQAIALQRTAGNRAVATLVARSARARRAARSPAIADQAAPPALLDAVRARRAAAEGETIGDESRLEEEGAEAEYPAGFIGPLQAGDTRAVPHDSPGPVPAGAVRSASFHPTMTVVTPGAATTDCGSYTYKVRWGVPASEAASAGWIVQKVTKRFEAYDCAGNRVPPQPADDPSGYPFWEAWEFTSGQHVWVGPASAGSPHSGDTFGGVDYGPGTRGRKTVHGEVKAIVGFVPPAGMTPRNAAPAWALPYTRTEPPQFASTLPGATHELNMEWNCCPNGTVTKATAVTTNP
jgi:hypothetical protein